MKQIIELLEKVSEKQSCGLTFEDISVNVYSDIKEILEYLGSFLYPYFVYSQSVKEAPFFELTCMINKDISNISARYFIAKQHMLLRDSENVESKYHGEINIIDGSKFIRTNDSLIVFCANTNQIILISEDLNHLKLYSRLIIRDIVQKAYENTEGVVFHGSSVVMEDGSIIGILGDKGSGKTTVLFEYLNQTNYKKHSLDRLLFHNENDNVSAVGWPTLLNIGIGTLSRCEKMKRFMPSKYSNIQNPDEFWEIKEKVSIEPVDLPYSNSIIKGKLAYLLFPKKNPDCIDSKVIEMDSFMIKEELKKFCYSPNDPNFIDWHEFVNYDEAAINQNVDKLIDQIASSVPCFYLKWGEKICLPF